MGNQPSSSTLSELAPAHPNPILNEYLRQAYGLHLRSQKDYDPLPPGSQRAWPQETIVFLYYHSSIKNPVTTKKSFDIASMGSMQESIAPFVGTFAIAPKDLGEERWDLLHDIKNKDLYHDFPYDWAQKRALRHLIQLYRDQSKDQSKDQPNFDMELASDRPYPIPRLEVIRMSSENETNKDSVSNSQANQFNFQLPLVSVPLGVLEYSDSKLQYLPQCHSIPTFSLPIGIEDLFDCNRDVIKTIKSLRYDRSQHIKTQQHSVTPDPSQRNFFHIHSQTTAHLPYISVALPSIQMGSPLYSCPKPVKQHHFYTNSHPQKLDFTPISGSVFPLQSSNMASPLIPSAKSLINIEFQTLEKVDRMAGEVYEASITPGLNLACICISLDATIDYTTTTATLFDPIHQCLDEITTAVRGGSIFKDLLDLNIHLFVIGVDETHLDVITDQYPRHELIKDFLRLGFLDDRITLHFIPVPYHYYICEKGNPSKLLDRPRAVLTNAVERASDVVWNEVFGCFFKTQLQKLHFFFKLVLKYNKYNFWINPTHWPSNHHARLIRYQLCRSNNDKVLGLDEKQIWHLATMAYGLTSGYRIAPKKNQNRMSDDTPSCRQIFTPLLYGPELSKLINDIHNHDAPRSEYQKAHPNKLKCASLNDLLLDSEDNPFAPFVVLSDDGYDRNSAPVWTYRSIDASILFSNFSFRKAAASDKSPDPTTRKLREYILPSYLCGHQPNLPVLPDMIPLSGGHDHSDSSTASVTVDDLYGYPYNTLLHVGSSSVPFPTEDDESVDGYNDQGKKRGDELDHEKLQVYQDERFIPHQFNFDAFISNRYLFLFHQTLAEISETEVEVLNRQKPAQVIKGDVTGNDKTGFSEKQWSYTPFNLTITKQWVQHDGTIRHTFNPSHNWPLLNVISQQMQLITDKFIIEKDGSPSSPTVKVSKYAQENRLNQINFKQYRFAPHFSTQVHSLFPTPSAPLCPVTYNHSKTRDNWPHLELRGASSMVNSLRFYNPTQQNLIQSLAATPVATTINYLFKNDNILSETKPKSPTPEQDKLQYTTPLRWLFGVHLFQYHHEVSLESGFEDEIDTENSSLDPRHPAHPLHHLHDMLRIPYIAPLTEVNRWVKTLKHPHSQESVDPTHSTILPPDLSSFIASGLSQTVISSSPLKTDTTQRWGELIKVAAKWNELYSELRIFEPYQISPITTSSKVLIQYSYKSRFAGEGYNNAEFLQHESFTHCNGHLQCPMHVIFIVPPDSIYPQQQSDDLTIVTGDGRIDPLKFKLHNYTKLTKALMTDYPQESIEARTIARFRHNLDKNCKMQLDLFWKRHFCGVPAARINTFWHFHFITHDQLEQTMVQIQCNAVLERLKLYAKAISP